MRWGCPYGGQRPYPPVKITGARMAAIMEDVKAALTAPLRQEERQTGTRTPSPPKRRACLGTFDEINAYFCDRGLTDGFPIVPPSEERVAAMLRGTKHEPEEVVTTTMWPAQWNVTVEKVAIVGVMAGCKPHYMPVLLATVEAFSKCGSAVRSTELLLLHAGDQRTHAQGDGHEQRNIRPGSGKPCERNHRALPQPGRYQSGGWSDRSQPHGHSGERESYAFCFPENEEESPWESFASEKGYGPHASTLTMFATGWSHCGNYLGGSLDDFARAMAQFTYPSGMAILVSPARAREWARSGQSKDEFKEYVWSHATLPMKTFRQDSYYKKFIEPELRGKAAQESRWPRRYLGLSDDAIVPVYPREGIQVVVVGADQNPMIQGWKSDYPTTVSIDKWR